MAVTGRVVSAAKLGDRWRAEVEVGKAKVVVIGQPGAGIASTTLAVGRTATVTGIARRPYPSATDRRYAVTPRSPADVRVAGRVDADATAATGTSGGTTSPDASAAPTLATVAPDADLVDLDARIGQTVRVGGLVVDLQPDGFTLDDGTAIGRVVLRGTALDRLALIEPDDALNAIGRVASRDGRRHRRRRRSGRHHPGAATPSRRAHRRRPRRHPDRPRRRPAHPRRSVRSARSARRPGRHAAVRRRDRRPRHAGRDLGRIGRRDPPPTGLQPPASDRPDRGSIGHVRGPSGDPPGGPSAASVAERGPSTIHSA